MKTKQCMIGISEDTKKLLDEKYKQKGYGSRSKYIRALLIKDIEDTIPEHPYI